MKILSLCLHRIQADGYPNNLQHGLPVWWIWYIQKNAKVFDNANIGGSM